MMSFKKEFLDLLDKDIEFRYAIAGYLGLTDVLKRLDEEDETIKKSGKACKRFGRRLNP